MGEITKYEKVMRLALRRGFFWQSYEIYGGVAGFYDLGPLGTMLKNKILSLWRKHFVVKHSDIVVEVETPVIGPEKLYVASGHVEHFTDPVVECLSCGRKFRADHLVEEKLGLKAEGLSAEELSKLIAENNIRCPVCGGPLSGVRKFNLLFKTTIGPFSDSIGYLRPETAQGIFTAFKRVYEVTRNRFPLGIVQIGRVARNEISPRQGLLRLREFTIAEMEFFFDPEEPFDRKLAEYITSVENTRLRILTAEDKTRGEDSPKEYKLSEAIKEGVIKVPWLGYWMAVSQIFVNELGIPPEKTYFDEKLPEERAHYADQTFDQMVYIDGMGWTEIAGHAYRTDYDLSRHMEHSGQDLRVFKQYEKPITRRKVIVTADRAWLGRTYGRRSVEILKKLETLSPDKAKAQLDKQGYIEVDGISIPKEFVLFIEKEEKESGRKFVPHVVEPSFGVERLILAALTSAYTEKEDRIILSLPRYLAPYDAAVFPLTRDKELVETAKRIWSNLKEKGFLVLYDDADSIGRRYARVDEIGVPAAITVDYDTPSTGTVTLRDRDTWLQVRIAVDCITNALREFLEGVSLERIGAKYSKPDTCRISW
jgi:glycyl-tRNA synthetase